MGSLIVVEAPDGSTLAIETQYQDGGAGTVRRGLRRPDVVEETGRRIEELLQRLEGTLEPLVGTLRSLAHDADQVEVQFGVGFTAECDVVVSSIGGGANFSVTLRWNRAPGP